MSKITELNAREILDSRGNPTVEVKIKVNDAEAVASVPSGASTGLHEAIELRDNDKSRYGGKGVLNAVLNVNNAIKSEILNKQFDQTTLDNFLIDLDGTSNKARLGANAILGVSMAFAKAKAKEEDRELFEYLGALMGNENFKLPTPMLNVINGGKHADSGLDIQEFMLAPLGFDNFKSKIQAGAEIISVLSKILSAKGYATSVGDEGGFAPKLTSNEEALELLCEAIDKSGYTGKVKIAMDVAASSFYEDQKYKIKINGNNEFLKQTEMISWYENLINSYPIVSIEDPFAEDDWESFIEINKKIGNKIMIVGDDLTVTNVARINEAIEKSAINSVLIKLNQIGTLTETLTAINLTKTVDWVPFISHRSGETSDIFIADLSVGLSCEYIKSGSLARGERVAKYNRLMEIEDILLNK